MRRNQKSSIRGNKGIRMVCRQSYQNYPLNQVWWEGKGRYWWTTIQHWVVMKEWKVIWSQSMGKLQRLLMHTWPTPWVYQLSWAETCEKSMCFTKTFCTWIKCRVDFWLCFSSFINKMYPLNTFRCMWWNKLVRQSLSDSACMQSTIYGPGAEVTQVLTPAVNPIE